MKKSALNINLMLGMIISCGFLANVNGEELAYVSNEKDNTVSVIDVEQHKVLRKFEVGQRPRGLVLNHDGTIAYLCASDSDSIQIIDLVHETVVGDLPSGEDPETIALHPNGKTIYTSVSYTHLRAHET